MLNYPLFKPAIVDAGAALKRAPIVQTGYWQGLSTAGRPEMATHEVLNHSFSVRTTHYDWQDLIADIDPDLPWADDHFQERVSGAPLNPPPSEAWWPHAPKGNAAFKTDGGIFSHTYPERYWPKQAGKATRRISTPEDVEQWRSDLGGLKDAGYQDLARSNQGIRFQYGDLSDLVACLKADPFTRQAFLPLWFPEDLGAPMHERKPCTLGYHFIMRDNVLHCVYYIRSCDYFRHFRNDIYMTVRLQHWVLDQLKAQDDVWNRVVPGSFTMHITSLHLFRNDFRTVFPNG